MEPFFSIIVPTKNNEKQIDNCLTSLELLDYPKDRYEIIVSDGHSSDHTVDIARRHGVIVFHDKGNCRASGCNVGFDHARGDFIAFTDADCIVDKNWLRNALCYFERDGVAGIGGPNFPPKDASNLTRAVHKVFLLSPAAINFNSDQEVRSLAGCNSIYRKRDVEHFFPLPETIAAEDTLLNYHITQAGYCLLSAPTVIVWHDRHYKTRIQFLRQMILYGKGNAQISKLAPKIMPPLQKIEALFLPIVIASGIFFGLLGPIFFLLFGIIVCALFVSVILKTFFVIKTFKIAWLLPQMLFLCLAGLSFGYIKRKSFS